MKCFSYKGGCGVRECMHIEALKEELAWAIDKRFRLLVIKCYLEQLYH